MKEFVKEHFKIELVKAENAIANQDFETAWTALQRTHILGQMDAVAHTTAHWHMLKLAFKQRNFKEVATGQLIQTLLAFPLTLLFGKTRALRGGKANVTAEKRMSVPEDIQKILNQ